MKCQRLTGLDVSGAHIVCGEPVVPTVGPHQLCSKCRIETERAVKLSLQGLRASVLREEATLVSLAIDLESYRKEEPGG